METNSDDKKLFLDTLPAYGIILPTDSRSNPMEGLHESCKKAEERRNEILDAADELFGQKGFDGTSTNDLLEKVGIARGTLYHHFKSKEDIMDALIDRYAARLLEGHGELPRTRASQSLSGLPAL